MFLGNRSKWTVNRIKDVAQQELSGLDEKLLGELWDWINLVFQKWKLEHGDREPKSKNRGRLSDLLETPIPFDEAEPWECAGLVSPSRIGLALKIWHDKYPPFALICRRAFKTDQLCALNFDQGLKPPVIGMAVDKCSAFSGSVTSLRLG